MSEINYIKEFINTDIYEIGNYTVRIPHKAEFSVRTSANEPFSPEDGDMLSHKTITIKNNISGASSTKRCYQYENALLEELQNDYNGPRIQFKWK